MSERRFDGWEPAETHEHYDAVGNLTGTTVVTHEPEWDDVTRSRAEALTHLEDTTCASCQNDLLRSSDADVARLGVDVDDTVVCWSCAAKEQHERHLHEVHKDNPSFFDGRALIATLLVDKRRTEA